MGLLVSGRRCRSTTRKPQGALAWSFRPLPSTNHCHPTDEVGAALAAALAGELSAAAVAPGAIPDHRLPGTVLPERDSPRGCGTSSRIEGKQKRREWEEGVVSWEEVGLSRLLSGNRSVKTGQPVAPGTGPWPGICPAPSTSFRLWLRPRALPSLFLSLSISNRAHATA